MLSCAALGCAAPVCCATPRCSFFAAAGDALIVAPWPATQAAADQEARQQFETLQVRGASRLLPSVLAPLRIP